jgi:DNA-binding NtrC family response regulator
VLPKIVEERLGWLFFIPFSSAEGQMGKKLIFVVDDERAIADTVAVFLEQRGFAVATFTSPVDALAASASRKPDLLLSDFKMHRMDGLTLATKLTERHPTCKVLIMSGDIYDANTHPALNRFKILQKPIPLPSLLAKIAEMLGWD